MLKISPKGLERNVGKERLRTYFEINWFSYEVKWPSTRSLDTAIVKAVWLKVTSAAFVLIG